VVANIQAKTIFVVGVIACLDHQLLDKKSKEQGVLSAK